MEITRGDSKGLYFARKNSDGTIITAEATYVYFTVKRNSSTETVLLQKTIDDMTFDENGYYHFTIEPEDTEELSYGTYYYDLEVKNNDNYVKTIAKGTLTITEEITFKTNEV